MEQKKLKITCQNKDCGKTFVFSQPSVPGTYTVKCPFCQHSNRFSTPSTAPKTSETKPKEGLQPDGSYIVICKRPGCNASLVAKKYSVGINHVTCPKCQTVNEFEIQPTEGLLLKCQDSTCGCQLPKPEGGNGIFSYKCKCGQEYSIRVDGGKVVEVKKKTMVFPSISTESAPMQLVIGRFLSKKIYPLGKGTHIIGRDDSDEQSNFPIKDTTVSRRSIQIDVNSIGGSLSYKMTVLRSTNPVYHNSVELTVGDIVYLNYGDTIKLGNTLIKVQKA